MASDCLGFFFSPWIEDAAPPQEWCGCLGRQPFITRKQGGLAALGVDVEGMIGGVGRGNGVAAGEVPLFEPLSPVPNARTLPTFLAVKL